jgi:hypothetical protein
MHATDTIYSDLDIAQLDTLPLTQPHRVVDMAVADADQSGSCDRLSYDRQFIDPPHA